MWAPLPKVELFKLSCVPLNVATPPSLWGSLNLSCGPLNVAPPPKLHHAFLSVGHSSFNVTSPQRWVAPHLIGAVAF